MSRGVREEMERSCMHEKFLRKQGGHMQSRGPMARCVCAPSRNMEIYSYAEQESRTPRRVFFASHENWDEGKMFTRKTRSHDRFLNGRWKICSFGSVDSTHWVSTSDYCSINRNQFVFTKSAHWFDTKLRTPFGSKINLKIINALWFGLN